MSKQKDQRKPLSKSQKERRQGINLGPGLDQVSTVTDWYRADHFASEEQARGAFELAYQQGLDGMGPSVEAWMGMTEAEYSGWMRGEMPRKRLPKPPSAEEAKLAALGPFSQWLMAHNEEDSPLGDLASDALCDSAWNEPYSLKALESHLRHKGACAEAIETAREAWGEFSQTVPKALQGFRAFYGSQEASRRSPSQGGEGHLASGSRAVGPCWADGAGELMAQVAAGELAILLVPCNCGCGMSANEYLCVKSVDHTYGLAHIYFKQQDHWITLGNLQGTGKRCDILGIFI